MTSDTYDSDDAMNWSPPPVAQKIKYEVDEPLPPFVTDGDATEKCARGTPGRSRKPHLPETQAQTRYGDSVLISYLEPARPDIAAHEREFPLAEWSLKQDRAVERKLAPVEAGNDKFKSWENVAHQLQGDDLKRDRNTSLSPRNKLPLPPPPVPVDINCEFVSPRQPPPVLPSVQASDRRPSEGKLRLSPPKDNLRPSPNLKNRLSLPSLQFLQSPPSSCAGTSPDTAGSNNQVLPSIRSALDGLSPNEFPSSRHNGFPPPYSLPGSATSRNDSPHDRQLPQFLPQQIPPSPFSHFSPVSVKDASNNPSPASQTPFWRGPPPPPPPQPPPETHHAATPYDMSTMTTESPATSYPTPTEQVGPVAGPGGRDSFSSNPSPNGAPATGCYKCTHPGCTAPPFQTQYLLNSHANVHSQDRPHFCPVDGCPRGAGGKGFKRKNEMMRHGLVHNSPGYVCPFCPDQQHKYPRPDNLQRHVRVHHVDKNKDDPILRQVLAQRPIGSTRGRRRRMNS